MIDLFSRVNGATTIISSYARPQLLAHGGDVVLLKVADEQVFVKVLRSCQAYPSLSSTIQEVVQETLCSELALSTLTVTVGDDASDEFTTEVLRITRK